MIIIVDNGCDYSDHSLYFFEGTEKECEAISNALSAKVQLPYEMPFVVGIAASIEWRHGGQTLPAKEFRDRMGWMCECGRFNAQHETECIQCDKPEPK